MIKMEHVCLVIPSTVFCFHHCNSSSWRSITKFFDAATNTWWCALGASSWIWHRICGTFDRDLRQSERARQYCLPMRKICRSGGPVHHCHWQTWWRWGYCYHSQQCLSLQLAGGFVARFSCSSCCNLGEFDLSEKILKENAEMSEHCKAVVQAKQHVAQGYPKELVAEALIGGWRGWDKNIVGEWVSDSLEIFKSPEKGLGVRTKCQVLGGATLIVQRPRASADANAEKDKDILTSLNTTARLVDNASKVKLAAQISSAASKDMLLARTVSCLDDGLGKDRQVVGFNILLDQLQPVVLPFLLQQPEFFPEKERLEISHASVQGVVSVNCHGSNSKSTFESSGTSLYPAISLINHSSSPNCALIPITPSGAKNNRASGASQEDVPVALMVGANRDLPQGTELTLCYIDDADAVKRKWNISE